MRKNFEKVFENNTDESYVGNLEAIHAIEQAFLNDAIPDDLQWQAILLAGYINMKLKRQFKLLI